MYSFGIQYSWDKVISYDALQKVRLDIMENHTNFSIFLCLYLQDEEIVKKPTTGGSKSKLPKQVQELVALIFDVDTMKNALVEFEVSSAKESLYIIIYIISDV